ncbi:MAG TPA: sensor domain-containing diguanylate cyclase [Nitrospirota bacterium]|nr:sensor domain-containing diguanylate cyclase [Nitrospirota bacterium]
MTKNIDATAAKNDRKTPAVPARDLKQFLYSRLTETHLFCEVGRIIASELQPAELIQKVIAIIRNTVGFDEASVYIVKKDLSGLIPIYFSNPSLQDKLSGEMYFDNGAPGFIAARGDPLLIDKAELFDGFLHHPDEERKQGSYIGIPLQNADTVIGIMGFSRTMPVSFRVEELDLLRMLSYTIAAGIEKAELFSKTLEFARRDELTGMFNYRVLMEKLQEEVARQVRTGRDFSFIMIDIDNFKRVNDRYGHLEGSRVIAQIGALLRDELRSTSTDTCFRYGGEEFSIVLGETAFDRALQVAERLRGAIEEYPFSLKSAHPSEVLTVSLGVSSMRPGENKTVTQLIHESDVAMYRSKTTGKNRVTGYDPSLTMPSGQPDDGKRYA